jgi:hypothetical protein
MVVVERAVDVVVESFVVVVVTINRSTMIQYGYK